MRLQAFTLSFILAFLLFAVQPMATKMVLPTLGGTPAVWNTVMFTFQILLLGGYCYAHLLARTLNTRGQILTHGALILATCLFLPLSVHLTTSDAMIGNPIPYLLKAFLLQLGLPFFCLAATAPLLQSWVSRSPHPLSQTPYVLYSASNFGSFAGLLGYVCIVEPLFDLQQQSMGWSVLYAAGMLALIVTGMQLRPVNLPKREAVDEAKPSWRSRANWMWLAFLPSSLSLGVTTYIATDVASVPLLWVIPLSIYLLSFVDAFRTKPVLVAACQRYAPLFGLVAMVFYGMGGVGFLGGYVFQLFTFGILAVALHGWLALRQPPTRYLTQFYVCLSIGGALGGVLNGLVAPLVFRGSYEYPLVLIIASLTAFILLRRREENNATTASQHVRSAATIFAQVAALAAVTYVGWSMAAGSALLPLNSLMIVKAGVVGGILVIALHRRPAKMYYAGVSVLLLVLFALDHGVAGYKTMFKDRNFFGVARIYEDPSVNARYFMHDTTLHGLQSLDAKKARTPQAYYAALHEVFNDLPSLRQRPMAVIGLGIGTVKCFAGPKQHTDFYEINPMAEALAENAAYFTYMRDCPGTHDVLLGDGRIRIAEQPEGRYNLLIIDAFSSDAIPSHLLTREAFATYLSKLRPGGVIVMNTTNRHIDLWPLLGAQVKALDLVGYGKSFASPEDNKLAFRSKWVIIARKESDVKPLIAREKGWEPLDDKGHRPWTDQYINLLPYFKALQ